MMIKTEHYELSEQKASYFASQFKAARAIAQLDSEDFQEILFTLERFGSFLTKKANVLSKCQGAINEIACESHLATEIPKNHKSWHIPFCDLYEMIRIARNDALHQGAVARHLTTHAIKLSIVLEDALMSGMKEVSYFMVRNPVCAYFWQPISFVRQEMLVNSFSYLPVQDEDEQWHLISDVEVARYLRVKAEKRKERLGETIAQTYNDGGLILESADWCSSKDEIDDVLKGMEHLPFLVSSPERPKSLIGILTPFDLL